MKNVISKELLSEVLNDRITHIFTKEDDKYIQKDYIVYIGKEERRKKINIHELIDKCKVWAFKNGMCSIDLQYDEIFYFLVVKMFSGKLYQSLHISKDDILIGELKAYQWIYEKEIK